MPQNFPGIFPYAKDDVYTFSWTEVVDATGFVLYDAWSSNLNPTDKYHLTPSTHMPDLVPGISKNNTYVSGTASTSGSHNKDIDVDFDITPYNNPRTLRGQAQVRVSLYLTSGGGNYETYVVARIRKWNGATETEIASVQSVTESWNSTRSQGWTLPIDIPQTTFKYGEQLRLTIEVWTMVSAGSVTILLLCQPSDAAVGSATAGNTRLLAIIPYKMIS